MPPGKSSWITKGTLTGEPNVVGGRGRPLCNLSLELWELPGNEEKKGQADHRGGAFYAFKHFQLNPKSNVEPLKGFTQDNDVIRLVF